MNSSFTASIVAEFSYRTEAGKQNLLLILQIAWQAVTLFIWHGMDQFGVQQHWDSIGVGVMTDRN